MPEIDVPDSKIYDAWTRIYQKFLRDAPNKTEQDRADISAVENYLEFTLVYGI